MTSRTRTRQRWVVLHLWVALIVGFPLALLGASGALLALKAPLLRWEVGAAPFTATPQALPLAGESAWKAAAAVAYPQFDRVMGALAPRAGFLPSDNALVFGSLHGRKGFGIAALDPYTASRVMRVKRGARQAHPRIDLPLKNSTDRQKKTAAKIKANAQFLRRNSPQGSAAATPQVSALMSSPARNLKPAVPTA